MKPRITLRGRQLLESGFRRLHNPARVDPDAPPLMADLAPLLALKKGQAVQPRRVTVRRAASPLGLSEAALIRLLQEHGIGRPSTYADTIQALLARGYAVREGGLLCSTEHGRKVCAFLVETFPQLFSLSFTARMEKRLDEIAAGKATYVDVLSGFWAELAAAGGNFSTTPPEEN